MTSTSVGLAGLSDAALEDQILSWAGRLAAGEARLLELVAEFDRREAWGGVGMLSCAHWLSLHLGLGPGAAREKVRVAKALRELPEIAGAFGAGRMSFAQVRAVSRVATVADQQQWIELARHASGSQLEKLARGVRRARQADLDAADPQAASWRSQVKVRYDEDGSMTIRVRVRADQGALLLAGIEQSRDLLDQQARQQPDQADQSAGDVPAETPTATGSVSAGTPARASQAAGFVHLIQTGLEALGAAHPATARRHRSALTVQMDPLSGWARLADGELLPPITLKTVLRSLPGRTTNPTIRPLLPADLTAHDRGRDPAHRHASLALRDLLAVLDGQRCRFPGCTRHRKLHAHHVVHWDDGGPTDLNNLILVCSRHHTLIHQHRYQLVLHPDRTLTVHTHQGRPLPHHPALPWNTDTTTAPDTHTRLDRQPDEKPLDLGYAISILSQQAA